MMGFDGGGGGGGGGGDFCEDGGCLVYKRDESNKGKRENRKPERKTRIVIKNNNKTIDSKCIVKYHIKVEKVNFCVLK